MRVHKGTTSGLWQSYLHITPEVEYWFSAKQHQSQERCATLVNKPCTPRGMMGEQKSRGKKAKSNNWSPVEPKGAKRRRITNRVLNLRWRWREAGHKGKNIFYVSDCGVSATRKSSNCQQKIKYCYTPSASVNVQHFKDWRKTNVTSVDYKSSKRGGECIESRTIHHH